MSLYIEGLLFRKWLFLEEKKNFTANLKIILTVFKSKYSNNNNNKKKKKCSPPLVFSR